jgi:hypothetical protein
MIFFKCYFLLINASSLDGCKKTWVRVMVNICPLEKTFLKIRILSGINRIHSGKIDFLKEKTQFIQEWTELFHFFHNYKKIPLGLQIETIILPPYA